MTLFLGYEKQFAKHDLHETLHLAIPSIFGIIKKYIRLLVPIGVLRAISTAMGQKMLEIGIDVFNKVPKSSIIIIIISMVGAIVGNILAIFFKKNKKRIAIIFTIIL
jgi:hypothetical protein